ncbi:sensor histidine kinase [Actinoplanes sp. NPDC049265]|uniref:sensor histidine kinase n=1 Tax=Actinoplanes sp. NPDC049265 TaxID=3363902 RepID=UPI003722417D
MTRPSISDVRGSVIDAAAAVVLAWLAVSATLDPPGPAFTGPAWIAWLAGVAVAVPLVVRRRWPVPVFVFVLLAAALATGFGVVGPGAIFTTWVPVAVALYTVAAASAPAAAAALALVAGLTAPAITVPWLYARAGISPASAPASEAPLWWQVELGVITVGVAAAWAAGRLVRWRRTLRAELARRSARDAVAAERLRIARELHDIVGHSMSLIAVKATVANHIADERPAETRAALLTIEQTSRSALTELRHLLDILRAEDDPPPARDTAGITDLSELAERVRSAGLPVELELGDVAGLPAAVGLTVYRIVQESLTNALKHADARRCRVRVRAGDGEVHIEVVDDGRARRPPGRHPPGRGLVGMRERVSMYGGTLACGPRREGGFEVIADFPYATAAEIGAA